MKSLFLTLAGTAVLLVAGAALFLTVFTEKNEKRENSTLSEELPFIITVIRDTVFLKDAAAPDFAKIQREVRTWRGATIKTDSMGRALLTTGAAIHTMIDHSSELTIAEYTEDHTSLKLFLGNLWSRVEKTFEQGEFYEIETQNAVAAVRGTSFGTRYINDTTTILVTEGVVMAMVLDPITGARVTSTEIAIPAGKKAEIGRNGKIKITAISKSDMASAWFRLNNPPIQSKESSSPEPKTASASDILIQKKPFPPPIVATPLHSKLISVTPQLVILDPQNPQNITVKGEYLDMVRELYVGVQLIKKFFVFDQYTIVFNTSELTETGTFDIHVVDTGENTETLGAALTVEHPSPPPPPQEPPPGTNNLQS